MCLCFIPRFPVRLNWKEIGEWEKEEEEEEKPKTIRQAEDGAADAAALPRGVPFFIFFLFFSLSSCEPFHFRNRNRFYDRHNLKYVY